MRSRPTGYHDTVFRLAGVTLASSVALGTAVRHLGLRLGRWRWIHHALFGASLATSTAAAALDRTNRPRRATVSAGVVGILLLLPLTSGGSRPHSRVGLTALGTHLVGARLTRP